RVVTKQTASCIREIRIPVLGEAFVYAQFKAFVISNGLCRWWMTEGLEVSNRSSESRIADHVLLLNGYAISRKEDQSDVLNRAIEVLGGVTRAEYSVAPEFPVGSDRVLVFAHRLDIRVNGMEHGAVGTGNVGERGHAQVTLNDQSSRRVGQRNRTEVQRVEFLFGLNENLPAKGATRQVVLHGVIKHAVAAVDFQLAITCDIPGAADTRSNFVTPAEANRRFWING